MEFIIFLPLIFIAVFLGCIGDELKKIRELMERTNRG